MIAIADIRQDERQVGLVPFGLRDDSASLNVPSVLHFRFGPHLEGDPNGPYHCATKGRRRAWARPSVNWQLVYNGQAHAERRSVHRCRSRIRINCCCRKEYTTTQDSFDHQDSPVVATAPDYMWDNFGNDLQPDDQALHVGRQCIGKLRF